jgi:tRNA G18 (ribose-2'-O)-methylase SpoU
MEHGPDGTAVRCPDPACARVFPVPARVLGRNTRCPACGIGLTARPLSLEGKLQAQEARLTGGPGAPDLRRLPLVVVVDSVRSLWNVGSIFRTADACGVGTLVLCGITGTPPRPEISKTALGAEAAVAWRYRRDAAEAVRELAGEGYAPVALESAPEAVDVHDFTWPERTCLVIGNEVAGVSPPALVLCRRRVRIAMRGVKDSLNVAVAFGIAAAAAARSLELNRPAAPPDS